MDAHHKQLMDILNRVYDAYKAGSDGGRPDRVANTRLMQELVDYTVMHFTAEEALMEREEFPDTRTHKLIHKSLLDKVKAHVNAFHAGDGSFSEDFVMFLKVWLSSHIQGIDRKYGKHINPGFGNTG